MNGIDEVVRVALVADAPARGCDARLRQALSRSTLPGFRVDLVTAPGPHHDLIHLLNSSDTTTLAARADAHGIGVVASHTANIAPADCRLILSPSAAADTELVIRGADPGRLWRWQPGVSAEDFGPAHYAGDRFPARTQINVLHRGIPADRELVLTAFELAARMDPRLHLHLIGAPPVLRLPPSVSVLPEPDLDGLATLYASADLLLHAETDLQFPLAIREAQASGLPVLALDTGGAAELVENGRDGVLVPATVPALAEALRSLARRATLRERLAVGGLASVRTHSWNRALENLIAAWAAALAPVSAEFASAA